MYSDRKLCSNESTRLFSRRKKLGPPPIPKKVDDVRAPYDPSFRLYRGRPKTADARPSTSGIKNKSSSLAHENYGSFEGFSVRVNRNGSRACNRKRAAPGLHSHRVERRLLSHSQSQPLLPPKGIDMTKTKQLRSVHGSSRKLRFLEGVELETKNESSSKQLPRPMTRSGRVIRGPYKSFSQGARRLDRTTTPLGHGLSNKKKQENIITKNVEEIRSEASKAFLKRAVRWNGVQEQMVEHLSSNIGDLRRSLGPSAFDHQNHLELEAQRLNNVEEEPRLSMSHVHHIKNLLEIPPKKVGEKREKRKPNTASSPSLMSSYRPHSASLHSLSDMNLDKEGQDSSAIVLDEQETQEYLLACNSIFLSTNSSKSRGVPLSSPGLGATGSVTITSSPLPDEHDRYRIIL